MLSESTDLKSVLIVDDHEMVAQALGRAIDLSETLRTSGIATTPEAAISLAVQSRPDVALIDVQLPGQSGFDIAAEMFRQVGHFPVIFLSGMLSDLHLHRALSLHCAGFLIKGGPISFLCDALNRATQGKQVFCDEALARLEADPQTGRLRCRQKLDLMKLSSRQLDVLRHLASGLSVRDIATRMQLTEKAVDSQKYRLMKRLCIHDRVELSRMAIREGLLEP
ncbi:response regulator [Planctomicrobium sp. SH664]|uniref:response regulator n=1 Tax=Planctomicrobium sp. SH664 TaxID=3448125 RepID=UPI003F5B3F83